MRTSRARNLGFLRKCANLCVETAFIASSFILVNKPLSRHMIQHGNCFFQCAFSGGFITRCNCRKNTFNMRTHHRTLTRVALTRLLGLASALFCLSRIGHGLPLNSSKLRLADYYDWPLQYSQSSVRSIFVHRTRTIALCGLKSAYIGNNPRANPFAACLEAT